jgi:hypothetical protein
MTSQEDLIQRRSVGDPGDFALGQDLEEATSSRGGWLVGART